MAPEYDPENLYTLTDQDGNQQKVGGQEDLR